VIEAAQKRISQFHSRKAQEATKAADAIAKINAETQKTLDKAKAA
jgi:hypothetical protein